MINMQFNGEAIQLADKTSVAQLLALHDIGAGRFIVVLNDELLVQPEYADTILKADDVVEIMSPITGG